MPASPVACYVVLVPTKIKSASSIITEYTFVLVGTFSCIKKMISRKRESVT